MQASELAERLTAILEPEAQAHGFELVGVEQSGGHGVPVVRVLLDREGGIDVDALAAANQWISAAIDTENPFTHPYTLEVSSPGIDRPLRRRADFERFAGETVTIRWKNGNGRATQSGVLIGMQDDAVLLEADGRRTSIPYDSIQKARLKGVLDFGKGKERSS